MRRVLADHQRKNEGGRQSIRRFGPRSTGCETRWFAASSPRAPGHLNRRPRGKGKRIEGHARSADRTQSYSRQRTREPSGCDVSHLRAFFLYWRWGDGKDGVIWHPGLPIAPDLRAVYHPIPPPSPHLLRGSLPPPATLERIPLPSSTGSVVPVHHPCAPGVRFG